MADRVHVEVLGRIVLRRDGTDITPRGALQRRLLGALALQRGEVAGVDQLADVLWPEGLPTNHQAALQTHVFRLRQLLPDATIESEPAGYRLCLDPDQVDAGAFEAALYDATRTRASDPNAAVDQLDGILAWWRGTPYEELGDVDDARIEAARLSELHLRALEERASARLELGHHVEVVADLEALAAHHPMRERPHELLMQALAGAGRAADALATFERYRRSVGDDLGIEPSVHLRRLHDDIVTGAFTVPAAPDRAPPEAEAETAGEAAGSAPWPLRPNALNEVVRYSSSFVGRDELIEEVTDLLHRARLVTLVGTGGVGKTRAAAEVCARLVDAAEVGRLWFCELAAADATSVVLTVAAALGIDQRTGTDHLARVAEVLRVQGGVLVLDNCEHVIEAAAEVAETILSHAPSVRILATSRERLAVEGEHLVVVSPLPVPDDPDSPAVQLFVDRAQAVRPDWAPDEAARAVVADLCRHLDGVPLAIELAAARLHTLTLDEVVTGLTSRFELLTGGRRTTARHRSLSAAVSWSYDLLSPPEKEMFDAISLFQSPFLAAGAAALLDVDEPRARALLTGLVERSLAHRSGPRYGVLESLRQLGAEHLATRGHGAQLRERHARHHLAYARETRARLRVPGDVGVLRELDASLADLRAAQRWFAEHAGVRAQLEYALALRDYGFYRMRPEVLGWAEDAARAADAAAVTDPLVGDAYAAASLEAWKRGEMARGMELIGLALAASEGLVPRYYVLESVGHHHVIRGHLEQALAAHTAALDTEGGAGDLLCRIESQGGRVLALGYADDPRCPGAVDALLGELGEASELPASWAWYTCGEVAVQSDAATAFARLERALELADVCGATFVSVVAGASAASIKARRGDLVAAVQDYSWLLQLGQRAGVRVLQWTMLRTVAALLHELGDSRSGAVLLGAVTSTAAGHEVFGADAQRLATLERDLRKAIGDEAVDAALGQGAHLDDDDAVGVALAAFRALG